MGDDGGACCDSGGGGGDSGGCDSGGGGGDSGGCDSGGGGGDSGGCDSGGGTTDHCSGGTTHHSSDFTTDHCVGSTTYHHDSSGVDYNSHHMWVGDDGSNLYSQDGTTSYAHGTRFNSRPRNQRVKSISTDKRAPSSDQKCIIHAFSVIFSLLVAGFVIYLIVRV